MGKCRQVVFVDMDGVVANFVKSALDVHGFDYDTIVPKLKGSGNLYKACDMSATEFWKGLQNNTSSDLVFWAHLELMSDAMDIMNLVEGFFGSACIYFLTSPSLSPHCHTGKLLWIDKHFSKYTRDTIITPHKHLLANKNTLLIDDSERNIEKFKAAGGQGFLVPRPWNKDYRKERELLHQLEKALRRFRRCLKL